MAKQKGSRKAARTQNYQYPKAEVLLRPDVGTQAQFKKPKPPKKYLYDSSLSPALDWDGQNSAREHGETLIRRILDAKDVETAKNAARELKALSKPFLNWAGNTTRRSTISISRR